MTRGLPPAGAGRLSADGHARVCGRAGAPRHAAAQLQLEHRRVASARRRHARDGRLRQPWCAHPSSAPTRPPASAACSLARRRPAAVTLTM
eukprot:scaffold7060_cov106-Isochrysis_galbana.AAC.2